MSNTMIRPPVIWTVRGLLVLAALLLLTLPWWGVSGGSDAAGNGMEAGFAAIGAMLGLGVLAGLALAWWRARARWALWTVAVLVAGFAGVLVVLAGFSVLG